MEVEDETAVSVSNGQTSSHGGADGDGKRVCTEMIGIERLPDAMLCHILSFLDTKSAVRKSLLSKRWRYLWISVPCIDLFCYHKDACIIEKGLRINTVSCLRKFSLTWYKDCKQLSEWISDVLKRDIEEIFLKNWGKQCIKLPSSIFTCKKLVILNLSHKILVNVPSSVYLPSLKILHIYITEDFDKDSMKNLLDGCPVIEELNIQCEEDYNVKTLFVRSSLLKSLTLNAGKFCGLSDVRIVAPKVERLYLTDYGNAHYDVNILSSLAKVDIFTSQSSTLVELLGKFSNAKFMCIASETRKRLDYQRLDLPVFHNLTYLKVCTSDPCLPVLPDILECSPNLVTFVYSVCHKANHQQQPQFKAPNCLMLHLEEIKLTGLKGFTDEVEMVRFFMENSMVLKKLSIKAAPGLRKQLEFTKKLLKFSRGSSGCEIIFD